MFHPPQTGTDVLTAFDFGSNSVVHRLPVAQRRFYTVKHTIVLSDDVYAVPLGPCLLAHSFRLDVALPALPDGVTWIPNHVKAYFQQLTLAPKNDGAIDSTWGDQMFAVGRHQGTLPDELLVDGLFMYDHPKTPDDMRARWSSVPHSFSIPLPFAATTNPREQFVPVFAAQDPVVAWAPLDGAINSAGQTLAAAGVRLSLSYDAVSLYTVGLEALKPLVVDARNASDVLLEQASVVRWCRRDDRRVMELEYLDIHLSELHTDHPILMTTSFEPLTDVLFVDSERGLVATTHTHDDAGDVVCPAAPMRSKAVTLLLRGRPVADASEKVSVSVFWRCGATMTWKGSTVTQTLVA